MISKPEVKPLITIALPLMVAILAQRGMQFIAFSSRIFNNNL